MTTRVLEEFKEDIVTLQSAEGTFYEILNDDKTHPDIQSGKIASRINYIDDCLNQSTKSDQSADTNLQIIATDLKYLALYLGEFQMGYRRRGMRNGSWAPPQVIEHRVRIESQWMSTGIGLHILCINILRKYTDKQWLDQVHSTFFMR